MEAFIVSFYYDPIEDYWSADKTFSEVWEALDTLQPVQVFLSTLHVLESTLQNNSVVIYACKADSDFARLVVRSREMRQTVQSLDMAAYPDMVQTLRSGKLFANRTLKSGYPAYALPVMDGGNMLAVLMLWNVPFDQQSMYMENFLSVVAGLVRGALARAVHYHSQMADLYYEGTHILMPEALRATLGIYQAIRQQRTGDYLLVRLRLEREMSIEVLDGCLGRLVRSTDLVGQLEDGAYYVLFPQATAQQLPTIEARFNNFGIRCEVVSEEFSGA